MVKCISLGEVNKSLLYIVLMSVSLVINQYIYGFTYIQCFYQMNIYKTFYLLIIDSEEKNENKFIRHRVFDPLFSYFGIIILSFYLIIFQSFVKLIIQIIIVIIVIIIAKEK